MSCCPCVYTPFLLASILPPVPFTTSATLARSVCRWLAPLPASHLTCVNVMVATSYVEPSCASRTVPAPCAAATLLTLFAQQAAHSTSLTLELPYALQAHVGMHVRTTLLPAILYSDNGTAQLRPRCNQATPDSCIERWPIPFVNNQSRSTTLLLPSPPFPSHLVPSQRPLPHRRTPSLHTPLAHGAEALDPKPCVDAADVERMLAYLRATTIGTTWSCHPLPHCPPTLFP